MSGYARPRLTIVSVLFGGADTLRETLPTWRESLTADVEVVFVDHSARALDVDLGLARWARYEWNPENPGFAAGVNRAVHLARSDRVFLLNPDVFLTEEALRAVVEEQSDGLLAVALRTDGQVHVGIEYSWWGFCRDRTNLDRHLVGPSGGAAVFPSDLVLRSHPFPDHLFAWGEDAEWGLGLCASGIITRELKGVVLEHVGGHSVDNPRGQQLKARLLVRNRIATFRRVLGLRTKLSIGAPFFAAIVVNLARKVMQGTARAYIRGVLEGLRLPLPPLDGPKLSWAQWKRFTADGGERG